MISYEDMIPFLEDMEQANKPKQTVPQMVYEFADVMKQKADPKMSAKLVVEEFNEWYDEAQMGYGKSDGLPEDELKELADLTYVIYGYARVRGWDLDEAIRRVHQNNLDRCIQPDGSIKYRDDGKVIKRENAPKVDLSDLT